MKTKIFLFFLCATSSFAQIKFVGAGGIGDGKAVPSAGANVCWRGWNTEARIGVIEEKGFLLLKLGREVLGANFGMKPYTLYSVYGNG